MDTEKSQCTGYNPDNPFRTFKLLEFPMSFVGLSTTQELDVEMDITDTSYLKTLCGTSVMDFEEAREISPSHRAFTIKLVNCHTLEITYTPSNECIAKVKLNKQTELTNRFVFDLRVIHVEGISCCYDERHAEVGRFYICGQYEYCNITNSPKVVNFGDVAMKSTQIRTIRIRNESKMMAAKMTYEKVTGFDVKPQKIYLPPNSSKKIEIIINPNSLKISKVLHFHIRNPHDPSIEPIKSGVEMTDSNFLLYTINVNSNIFIDSKKQEKYIESLHKIYEPHPKNTYLHEELDTHNERKELANQFLQFSKSVPVKKVVKEKFCSANPECYPDPPKNENLLKTGHDFCKVFHPKIGAPDLFSVTLSPQCLNFGKVGIKTYGEQELTIKNKSKYDITIKFKTDKNVLYTQHKLSEYTVKLKSQKAITIVILCLGFLQGNYEDTFNYIIDNHFNRAHLYKIQIDVPLLYIPETILKFGMATTDCFITSIPVKIYNDFNVPVDFEWEECNSESLFEILPKTGIVPMHGCKICDVTYLSNIIKTKTYTINFISKGSKATTILIEANIINRKITVKFLQQLLVFNDIPLNMETTETVKLENSSKEIAVFYVIEPLLPGMTVVPMNGLMRPKSILTFHLTMKIACVMDFFFDLFIRVNNKEYVGLQISGNIVEPKLTMIPKNIFMPRIPLGMITYVPLTVQNSGVVQSLVEILDTGDENIFDVFIQDGCDKVKVRSFILKPGHTKTLYIKVYDVFRREFDMYIPFKVNGLLGPPKMGVSSSTEVQYYIGEHEKLYESWVKVKVKPIHKDINFFRIIGVFTLPWIEFSAEKIEIIYVPNGDNTFEFSMKNISKYYFHVCLVTSKLPPHFSLEAFTEDSEQPIVTDSCIKFELDRSRKALFRLNFHPHGLGRISTVCTLYLDKAMSLPFHNLSFNGYREFPAMTASTHRIIFPPSYVGSELSKTMEVKLEEESELDAFTCSSKEESNVSVEIIDCEVSKVGNKCHTIITVKITVCCHTTYARNLSLVFHHECGSTCSVEICFCFTYCPITLHTNCLVEHEENPFPFYPLPTQTKLYDYLEKSTFFVERWMFQQGFRRDLFPIIPDTFHAIAPIMTGAKTKGINLSFLNFIRKIAGPLMKHVHKASSPYEEPYKTIYDIHETYKSIINLVRSRGANLWLLQAKFLLTYAQFLKYSDFVRPVYTADVAFTTVLRNDPDLYNRLTKQCWLDFILQCYKVFVMDSCFFDCVCVSSEYRDIEMILVNWYNDQIRIAHHKILKDTPVKQITNITTDLSNGIALISAIYNHCTFLEELLCLTSKVNEENPIGDIVHNACIIIEALNILRLYFPLTSKDFLEPIFLQMLFLSIHLYVLLPMFRPKDKIELSPPQLRCSSRIVTITPVNQETLVFTFVILNNNRNNFTVEKIANDEDAEDKSTQIIVKYKANFIAQENSILLVHGYNKTRIFDTYMTFNLVGNIGALVPVKKCKISAPIYRPSRMDVSVYSPFYTNALFKIYLTDTEPTIPVVLKESSKKGFRFKRLTLVDDEIILTGHSTNPNVDTIEHRVFVHLYCLNTQSENAWIWFRSEIGEFFIRVTTQPRWDLAVDTLQVKVESWPMDPCSCGEDCECYRSTVLMIPHRNELMLKALRYAMVANLTDVMVGVYDTLIETTTGQIILFMLLSEGGTKMSEVAHILRPETTYRISSRKLLLRETRVTLHQHTDAVLTLPVTIPPREKSEKYSILFSSEDGMDMRTYKILFIPIHYSSESFKSSSTSSSKTYRMLKK